MTFYLGAVLVAAVVVWMVVRPLFTGGSAPVGPADDEPTEAESRKRTALLQLRDVEQDYATGKLDERDYAELRHEVAGEALEAIRTRDLERERAAALSSESGPSRNAERTLAPPVLASVCSACGYVLETGSRFCSACGLAVAAGVPGGTSSPAASDRALA